MAGGSAGCCGGVPVGMSGGAGATGRRSRWRPARCPCCSADIRRWRRHRRTRRLGRRGRPCQRSHDRRVWEHAAAAIPWEDRAHRGRSYHRPCEASQFGRSAGDAVAIWEGDQAQQALSLIADLPGSEPYRCFLPGWGIRAHSSTDQLFEIAFCFRCHGTRIWGPGLPVEQQGQAFDAESPAALELIHRFRSCLPD